MKKLFKIIAVVSCCVLATSCVVISRPVAATDVHVGRRCGVSKSTTICGFITLNGKQCGINQAARNGRIQKISHVDSYTKIFGFGLIVTQVTKVYGE